MEEIVAKAYEYYVAERASLRHRGQPRYARKAREQADEAQLALFESLIKFIKTDFTEEQDDDTSRK